MGTLDSILADAGNQFGISTAKSGSLLSGLIAMITETPGGLGGFLDRFRKAGLGEMVSSWLSGSSPVPLSTASLEATVGRDSIDRVASKAGLSATTAASALAFMLPKVIQRLAPGGVIPTHLSSDILAYAGSATSAVAAGTRRAAYATEDAVRRSSSPAWLWPLLALLAIGLIGYWIWNSRGVATNTTFNIEEQVRMATQKAGAALAALKPDFSAQDLVSALNMNVINFPTGGAQIPADEYAFLNKVALAIKAAPSGTVLEIRGHTDNSGDTASNFTLSQQRADAVRNYLIEQGVDPNVLTAKGYGDSRPVGSNDTEEGKFRNRRIEFAVR